MQLEELWIEWLASKWNGKFHHSFIMPRNQKWESYSLRDACDHYIWKKSDFFNTELALNKYSKALISSIEQGDSASAFEHCMEILKWGGVSSDTKKGRRPTVQWLETKYSQNNLCEAIASGIYALRAGQFEKFDGKDLFMDSSSTKIFSMADNRNEIIIYDGRVGAALCLLAKTFLKESNVFEIREPFDFMWGGARTKIPNRNPSDQLYHFKALWSGKMRNEMHAKLVIRSTELIKKLSLLTNSSARQWEASLFMIGYSI